MSTHRTLSVLLGLQRLRWPCALVAFSLLAACGGGGGGSSTDNPATAQPAVVFTPASLNTRFVEGDEAWVEVTATASATLSRTVVARIVDSVGVIQADAQITATASDTYVARFQLNPGLAVGAHTGQLQLQLCKDLACAEPQPGSPWAWPYTIHVESGTHLTPLQPLAGAADWATFQGDFGHAGYAPAVLDATKFNRRWQWVPPVTTPKFGAVTAANVLQSVAVSQGLVYAATHSDYLRDRLYALDESNGSPVWVSGDLTFTLGQANPPTVAGGRVLMTTSNQSETALRAFDRVTGTPLYTTPFGSQFERYGAPVVVGGQVLTLAGTFGGLAGFDLATGASTWFNDSDLRYYESTPASDGSFAYALVGRSCNDCDDAGLGAIDPATGALAWRVGVPGIGYSTIALKSVPVTVGGVVYLYDDTIAKSPSQRLLSAFSVADRKLLWRTTGPFVASPVVGNGVVYAATAEPAGVEARSAADGSLLWRWAAPASVAVPAGQVPAPVNYGYAGCSACLVLTGNLLFYSGTQVHAIDLASHNSVWTHPRPGDLALSANGTLFIASSQGPGVGAWLTAINLR